MTTQCVLLSHAHRIHEQKDLLQQMAGLRQLMCFLLGSARELKQHRIADGVHPKSPWWENRGRRRWQLCNEVAKQQQVREGGKK